MRKSPVDIQGHSTIIGKASLVSKIRQVFSQGWIDLTRGGPTGPGKTWEDHLGISENNLSLPDIGNVEIKVLQENGSSALTLVSKALPYSEMLKYGVSKVDVIKSNLFRTRRDKQTGGLIQEGDIYYRINKGRRTVEWYLKPRASIVQSGGKGQGGDLFLDRWPIDDLFAKVTWLCLTYYIKRATPTGYGQMLPTRCYSFRLGKAKLMQLLVQGQIYYEPRAHLKPDGGTRDHGSAWRMSRRGLEVLLRDKKPIALMKTTS